MAVDTPDNLMARLGGSETLYVEVDANGADPSPALGRVAGVKRVGEANHRDGIVGYEVEGEKGRDIRRDLAREIVTSGWGLLELRPLRRSLEEIFLTLTTEESAVTAPEAETPEAAIPETVHE